jgi:NAD-dependent SIR2 family protein deacetylase
MSNIQKPDEELDGMFMRELQAAAETCDLAVCLQCGKYFEDVLMRKSAIGLYRLPPCEKCGGQLRSNPRRG